MSVDVLFEKNNPSNKHYKPINLSKDDKKTDSRGKIILHMSKVKNYHENDIYVSDDVKLKRRQLFQINKRVNDSLELLNLKDSKNKPLIYIVSQNEMNSNAIASYNVVKNIIFMNPKLGDSKNSVFELTKNFAKSNDPLSTILHELIHWRDAETYRKQNGNITMSNVKEYFKYCDEKALKELEKYGIDIYNVSEISKYAYDTYVEQKFDEVMTELEVKNFIERGEKDDYPLYR